VKTFNEKGPKKWFSCLWFPNQSLKWFLMVPPKDGFAQYCCGEDCFWEVVGSKWKDLCLHSWGRYHFNAYFLSIKIFHVSLVCWFLHLPIYVQISFEDKMNLVLVDILGNFPIRLVTPSSPNIPFYNNWKEDWIISIFDYVENYYPLMGFMCCFST